MFRTLAATALALSLTIASVAPSLAIGWAPNSILSRLDLSSDAFMMIKRPVMAPIGYVVFCAKYPVECHKQYFGADYVEMTPSVRRVLFSANWRINHQVRPVNDAGNGTADVWTVATNAGDCEDSALAKRAELLRLGFPPAALRIGIAVTPGGIGHAVLVVRTSTGDLILDNRHNVVRNWRDTDLAWVKVQSGRDPRTWYSV